LATERGVIAQGGVAADSAKAGGRIRQARREADTGPAANAGEDRNVLLAALLVGRHVSNDAGRGLELVELLARLGVNGFEIALQRPVEHHAAGRRQSA
jgi:hypothetical protein